MISEHAFAQQFPSFWGNLLPLLTSSFVRLFNEAFFEPWCDRDGIATNPVRIEEKADARPDLIAEVGFGIAEEAWRARIGVMEAGNDPAIRDRVGETAIMRVGALRGLEPSAMDEMVSDEWDGAQQLAQQYESLPRMYESENVVFRPLIRGAGYLGLMEADISIGDRLVEVKAVRGNISGRDIRQILVYLAMDWMSGSRRWTQASFFNPRRAIHYPFRVEPLVRRLSGGRPSGDVYSEILNFVEDRGIELDRSF